jgi:Ca2+-binding RTX toxin-like protein
MYIPGTSDNDTLTGTNGNDHFDGGAGDDIFQGGLGDDYYIVNSDSDQVIEEANQGVDSVVASVNYTLSLNVENLFLSDSATLGVGNSSSNYMVANAAIGSDLNALGGDDVLMGGLGNDTFYGDTGNDYLNGGAGSDILNGGAGNDYYVVDSLGDQVVEASGEGVDTLFKSVISSYHYLPANIENLFLGGSITSALDNSGDNYLVANPTLGSGLLANEGNDTLLGGAGNDMMEDRSGNNYLDGSAGDDTLVTVFSLGNDNLNGGEGNDQLVSGPGNDTLTGGAGNDRFYFYPGMVSSFASMGVDIITDFTSGQDQMYLYRSVFSGLTTINFANVTSDQLAASSSGNIVYNSTNGNLFYNSDGVTDGFGSGGLFAMLAPNLTLAASDFVII